MRSARSWVLAGAGGVGTLALVATGATGALAQSPTWGTVDSPNAGEFTNRLDDVYAAAPDQAWAVGSAVDRGGSGQAARTLLQHWDGQSWSQLPAAEFPELPDGGTAELSGVHGTGPDDVWAVGTATNGPDDVTGYRTVTLHWDGQDWTAVPSPNLGFDDDNNELLDVVAVSPDNAWTVGQFDGSSSGAGKRDIVLHWNGARWRSVNTPCGSDLTAIHAASASDVWAIGNSSACHFDGSSWLPARPELPGTNRTLDLADVAVLDSGDAVAVGSVHIPCGELTCFQAEVQRFDGARWSSVDAPDADLLTGMHALSGDAIWATASEGMHYFDGTEWSSVPNPDGSLVNVSASGPDDVWAVGSTSYTGSPSETVIQHSPAFE